MVLLLKKKKESNIEKRNKEVINKLFTNSNISSKKLRKKQVFIELFNKEIYVGKIIEIDKNLNLTIKNKEKILIINWKLIKTINKE